MSSDPIADMLTRIRNALMVGHNSVSVPSSKLKVAIAPGATELSTNSTRLFLSHEEAKTLFLSSDNVVPKWTIFLSQVILPVFLN